MNITMTQYKRQYLASDEAASIKDVLQLMVDDKAYNTRATYSPQTSDISFVDKHMAYLSEHPNINAHEYISNLKLKTRVRR